MVKHIIQWHSVYLSYYTACQPWWGQNIFIYLRMTMPLPATVVSLFSSQNFTADDFSLIPLSLCFLTILHLLKFLIGENYDLWIWSLNVISLHVFKPNVEVHVCLPFKIMRYTRTHMYRHCMLSVQGTGTSTHLSIKMWGCLSQLCKMVQCLQMTCCIHLYLVVFLLVTNQ